AWSGHLEPALDDVLHTPLEEPDSGLSLAGIALQRRKSEMEFTFPVSARVRGRGAPLTAAGLAKVFRMRDDIPPGYADRVGALGFAPLSGFLRGFIDLVFEHEGRFYVV